LHDCRASTLSSLTPTRWIGVLELARLPADCVGRTVAAASLGQSLSRS